MSVGHARDTENTSREIMCIGTGNEEQEQCLRIYIIYYLYTERTRPLDPPCFPDGLAKKTNIRPRRREREEFY